MVMGWEEKCWLASSVIQWDDAAVVKKDHWLAGVVWKVHQEGFVVLGALQVNCDKDWYRLHKRDLHHSAVVETHFLQAATVTVAEWPEGH